MLASSDNDSLELDQNLPHRISISELIAHKERLDKLLSNECFLDFFLDGTAKECLKDQLTSNQERVSSLLGGG